MARPRKLDRGARPTHRKKKKETPGARVAERVDEDVLRLEVAVDVVEAVDVLEREDDRGDVEPRDRLGHAVVLELEREELAAEGEFDEHVDVLPVLARGDEADHERVVQLLDRALLVEELRRPFPASARDVGKRNTKDERETPKKKNSARSAMRPFLEIFLSA